MRNKKDVIETRNCPECNANLRIMYTEKNEEKGGYDILAHCEHCHRDWEWYQDPNGHAHEMQRHFWG